MQRKLEQQTKKRDRRVKFERWLGEVSPELTWNWKYQRHVYQKLAAITRGECKRLMVFMPPRHGKSELITVRYTASRLLNDLRLNVILGSYNQKLADKFSRKIRRIFLSGGLKEERSRGDNGKGRPSPRLLNSSSPRLLSTASEWETPAGGVVRSVGVGGGIAGFGAGLIVIDDPVKNRAEAESATYRERVWEWFNDDIYTRMEPNAAIILIQTRWHEDDLAGRLLKEMKDGGEQWEVVSLSALAESEIDSGKLIVDIEKPRSSSSNSQLSTVNYQLSTDPLGRKPGAALCPKLFPAETLLKYQKKLGTYSF